MTIAQMECFIETAKTGNISRAAESLFITQQAVSGQIKNLERELRFPLFIRKSKGVVLTKEGEVLFEEWQELLSRLRISIDKAKDMHDGRSEHIRIGLADMGQCSEDIMGGFFAYEESFPELSIDYRMMTPIEMLQLFESNDLDMAILYQSEFDQQTKLKCMPLHRRFFKICIFLSRNHPLAENEDLTLVDLKDETIGVLNEKYSIDFRKKMTQFFSQYDAEVPKKVKEYSSRRELEMALIAGRCVTIVYEPMFLDEENKLCQRDVDLSSFSTRIALYWKEDYMDTKARSLAEILKKKLERFS